MSLLRSYNPIWLFDDLNGKICDDTFYLYTLENTLPYLPQNIWRDSSGVVPWSNPIQFLANGTLPDNMYWDDSLVYRLEIRQNDGSVPPSQADALIYEVNNYIPGTGAQIVPGSALSVTDNQITNPQFQIVNFTGSFIITTAGTFEIAPGWSVVTTGAGILTVTQFQQAGNVYTGTNQSNAPTGITLENNGFSTVTLKQRFNGNGALWTGAAVSGGVTASSFNGVTLSMDIRYSNISTTNIMSQALTTANTDYIESVAISPSTSAILPSLAWTDIDLSFNINTTVSITSVQLIGESSVLPIKYLQTTPERQIDETFHYYNLPLQYKPIPSLLTGWDFALNPAQEFGYTVTATPTPAYVWDQTIMASIGGNVSVYQDPNLDWLSVDTLANNQAFYIMQYQDGGTVKKMLGSKLCSMFTGYRTLGTDVTARIYLYRAPAATAIPNLGLGTIGTIATNGVFTLTAAGWTAIPRGNLGDVVFTVPDLFAITDLNTKDYDIGFNGWQITDIGQLNDTDKFCIVVTFSVPTSGTQIKIASVSLNLGDIPTRPAPLSADEVLRQCQYLYEKSYNVETPASPVPATLVNAFSAPQLVDASAGHAVKARQFYLPYKQTKRVTPAISFRDTNGNLASVTAFLFQSGAIAPVAIAFVADTNWSGIGQGLDGVTFRADGTTTLVAAGAAGTFPEGTISLHYVLDARYGKA